ARGRSAPKIFPDEIDGYERTKEGSQIGLIWQRAATFGDERLLFETSTPTIKGASLIESAFEQGDQRRWHCECPHCQTFQYLKWSQVNWQKDSEGEHLPETAVYVCESCGVCWDDADRFLAIRKGRWIAAKPFKRHASFHLPEMCSLFRKLGDIVQSFLEKKRSGDIQTFINVSLAETFEEKGQQFKHTVLMERAEVYECDVPDEVCILVRAVDVQKDRLEIKVKGFGVGEESWDIDYKILRGDPTSQRLWDQLDVELSNTYRHANGSIMTCAATGIDSGAFTDHVYRFVKPREMAGVYALKGRGQEGLPLVNRGSRSNKYRVNVFTVGTWAGKDLIYRRYEIEEPGAGYLHFKKSPVFDEEYFRQLCSEKKVTRFHLGKARSEWLKIRDRNEAFDLENYCLAVLYLLSPNLDALARELSETPAERHEKQQARNVTSAVSDNHWINAGSEWL
uniref:terminase gpA endonuclease subunit n=1 Tax=Pleionea sediminis TaxID=2569479 RepID=UPI001184B44D